MKKRTISKLKKLAQEKNDLMIYQLAVGDIDMLTFLMDYVKQNDLGDLAVSGTTLIKLLQSNNARRKTLEKWNKFETDEIYRKYNDAQLKILDDYAESQLIQIIENTEALKAQAVKDKEATDKKKARQSSNSDK